MAYCVKAQPEQVQKWEVTTVESDESPINESKRQKVQLQSDVAETEKQAKNQLLNLCKQLNNFFFKGFLEGNFVPFICEGSTVGLVPPWVVLQLRNYPAVFSVSSDKIAFTSHINHPQARSTALDQVLRDLKEKGTFLPLTGWRDECYEIKRIFSDPALFKIERSASPLFWNAKIWSSIKWIC